MYTYDKYVKDILKGDRIVSRNTKLTIDRYIKDLDNQKEYFFDKEKAERIIRYYTSVLRHIDKSLIGQPIELQPFQQFILANLFGWVNKDGYRRFRRSYIELPRKNGKSTFMCGIVPYMMLYDAENSVQAYALATKYDQARKTLFEKVKKMVEMSKVLKGKLTNYRNFIQSKNDSLTKFEALGSDSDTLDGLDTQLAIYDEYHAAKNGELFNVIRSSMGSRKQPLLSVITTAGFNKTSPCYIEREYSLNVLNGTTPNDSYFSMIYCADPEDDWTEKETWYKANPNLGVTLYEHDIKDHCQEAIDSPVKQNEFKTKRLNIWTQAENLWLNMEIFKKNRNPFREEDLEGCFCFAGIDLSWTTDITAFVMVFPPQKDFKRYRCLYRFYLPEFDLRRRSLRDRVPYDLWSEQGYITLTPGKTVDYGYVIADIKEALKLYEIKEIAYDPWNATQFLKQMNKENDQIMVEYKQGKRNISSGAKEYERKILQEKLSTNGNPVIEWMAACTSVESDADGNIKPVKPERSKTGKRIDGIVANIMAFDRAIRWEDNERSYYEDNDLEFITI